jgi:hypothetical protein
MIDKRVVLPLPEGPIRAVTAPGLISSVTSLMAATASRPSVNRFETLVRESVEAPVCMLTAGWARFGNPRMSTLI